MRDTAKKFFRKELIAALLITQNGHIRSREMQGSWAGAMGQTQFMPTSFKAYAVDYDGDGRKDIWTSYEDAFASTANYLQRSGWQKGQPWGWEVRLPSRLDVAKALKLNQAALIEWEKLGIRRADGQPFHSNTRTARLFLPAGLNGPAFLVLKNFDVIKRYNNSDSYALAVAYLGDRIRGSAELRRTWPVDAIPISRSETRELQTRLGRLGYRVGDQDGRVGPLTRISVLQFQKRNGLIPDAFPGREVLEQVRQRSLPTTGGN
ncbi:lytic murein transglycosylase [Ochrobactrum pecoris]|nr:lytic murein transglycosylase [Brucella pecoris]